MILGISFLNKLDTPKKLKKEDCPNCWRNQLFCICNIVQEWKHELLLNDPPKKILILQHVKEVKNHFNTGRILSLLFPKKIIHRVGLSWRSLEHALNENIGHKKWALLYPKNIKKSTKTNNQNPMPPDGIILLDASWKETKTLLWRNRWLLKLNTISLTPRFKTPYHILNREPKKNYISTLEAFFLYFTDTHKESSKVSDTYKAILTQKFSDLVGFWSTRDKSLKVG